MAQFFIEFLTEEIPARMQIRACEDLKKLLIEQLQVQGLAFTYIHTAITPRRLVAVVDGLETTTQETQEERRGPRITAPDKALEGFLKAVNQTKDQCTQRNDYWYATLVSPARETKTVLPDVIRHVIRKFSWEKSMRWPGATIPWVRPVRSIVALFDGVPLNVFIEEFGLHTGDTTQGHRFLKPDLFSVRNFDGYQESLRQAYVMLAHEDRKKHIQDGLTALGKAHGYTLEIDENLLNEVAGLVEYPVPLLGKIDGQFMDLPKCVLSTSMRVHQKYFTFVDNQQKIAPVFGFVANTIPTDDGALMRNGYERVLRARLSDAQFFYNQDLAVPLSDRVTKLDTIIFHEKLGTLGQKVRRLQEIVDHPESRRAALLCKADLVTSMVGEFPELQGIMGKIYAAQQGESAAVSTAIHEHYQPQGPLDRCPTNPISIELSLADKMDTLVGFFAIGEAPTGSKDPFALRRAALGVIRLIRENNQSACQSTGDLTPFIAKITNLYRQQNVTFEPSFTPQTVVDFILERLENALRAEGLRHDCIRAVLAIQTPHTPINIWSIAQRTAALDVFLGTEAGDALQAALRRATGILEGISTTDGAQIARTDIDPQYFLHDEERHLYAKITHIAEQRVDFLKNHAYTDLMTQLAQLRAPIDAFFTLKINDENPKVRQNRIELLRFMVEQIAHIADFRQLAG